MRACDKLLSRRGGGASVAGAGRGCLEGVLGEWMRADDDETIGVERVRVKLGDIECGASRLFA
jgi:hypothetical protein